MMTPSVDRSVRNGLARSVSTPTLSDARKTGLTMRIHDEEARPPVSAAGLITRQARLSFDDDQIFRRRPELVDVLDLEIAAEARSVTLRRFGVIETLSGNDLISSRGIGHCDLLDVAHVDRRELLAIQI